MKDKCLESKIWNPTCQIWLSSSSETSKFFVGIIYKKSEFIIHPEFLDANNIKSDPFIQNLNCKPNMVHDLSRKIKISIKNRDDRTVSNIKYTKLYRSLAIMVKQNAMKGHMQKMNFY